MKASIEIPQSDGVCSINVEYCGDSLRKVVLWTLKQATPQDRSFALAAIERDVEAGELSESLRDIRVGALGLFGESA